MCDFETTRVASASHNSDDYTKDANTRALLVGSGIRPFVPTKARNASNPPASHPEGFFAGRGGTQAARQLH